MGTFGGTGKIISIDTVNLTSGTGITTDVGHAAVTGLYYTGDGSQDGDIDANITNVTDIADPAGTGGWTDIVDITGKLQVQLFRDNSTQFLYLSVHSSEDSGDALRGQVLIDGTVRADFTVVGNNSDVITNWWAPVVTGSGSSVYFTEPIDCNSAFKIRVAKEGTFASASSIVIIGATRYRVLE